MNIEFLRKALCLIFGSSAFLFNLLLAFIILAVKCDHIGKYKWFLFLYTVSAMLNGATQILTMPHMVLNSYGNVFYDSFRVLPIFIGDIVLLIFSSCFFQNLVILTHCFIFRYYAVCNPDQLDNFVKKWPKIAVISTIILAIQMIALASLSPRSPEYEELMDAEFIESTGYSLKNSSYWACVVYTETGLNTNILVILVIFATFGFAAGAIMIQLALKIAETLKGCTWSQTVTNHHRRIFTLLLYQLTLPLVFNIFPQQIIIFSNYFHIETGKIVHILCCFLTFPQAIDPLLTFYLIRPYRKALYEKIDLVKTKNIRQACSTTVVPLAE